MTVHDESLKTAAPAGIPGPATIPLRTGEDLLTTPELAAHLKVPVATIHQWRHKGVAPPAARVGRSLRWRLRDVDAWLASHTSTGSGAA